MSEPVSAPCLSCPVCRARFRGSIACSRCGADLGPLMRVAAKAWRARERCRAALRGGRLDAALRWSARARRLQRIPIPPASAPDAGPPN